MHQDNKIKGRGRRAILDDTVLRAIGISRKLPYNRIISADSSLVEYHESVKIIKKLSI